MQKTAYEMRISDWSSDMCSSDLVFVQPLDLTLFAGVGVGQHIANLRFLRGTVPAGHLGCELRGPDGQFLGSVVWHDRRVGDELLWNMAPRSEEHTSELQSLMRISYAVFCLKQKKNT